MTLITRKQDLEQLSSEIAKNKRCAIDLEFIPERTYEPVLCLVQVATDHSAHLIDPLVMADLSVLWETLSMEDVLVVLHAANQDLELIYNLSALTPQNVFDTQIGAGFAGFGYPVGYGKLLNQLLGVSIAKTESFTDWTNRPLTQSQLEYATEDVLHLLPMYDRLCEILVEAGRFEWAQEECKRYLDVEQYKRDKTLAYLRVKGASSLSRRGLAVLQSLCDWRNFEAQRINKPSRSIISDNVLIELCRKPPRDVSEIQRIRGVRPDQARGYGSQLLAAIDAGLSLPDDKCPVWPSSRVPPKRDVLIGDVLFAALKVMTYEADLATELLATRDDVQTLVRLFREDKVNGSTLPLLSGWRWELAGRKLCSMLSGAPLMVSFDTQSDPPVRIEQMLIRENEQHQLTQTQTAAES